MQSLGTVLAQGVADARAGRWVPVSVVELLDGSPGDGDRDGTLEPRTRVMATATWRAQWDAVPEEARVRTLTVMVVASRHPLHPCLSVRRTAFAAVHVVGIGHGLHAALTPLPDGSTLWVALLRDEDLR